MRFPLSSRASVASRCFPLARSCTRRQDKRASIFGGKTLPPASSIRFLEAQLVVGGGGSSTQKTCIYLHTRTEKEHVGGELPRFLKRSL